MDFIIILNYTINFLPHKVVYMFLVCYFSYGTQIAAIRKYSFNFNFTENRTEFLIFTIGEHLTNDLLTILSCHRYFSYYIIHVSSFKYTSKLTWKKSDPLLLIPKKYEAYLVQVTE